MLVYGKCEGPAKDVDGHLERPPPTGRVGVVLSRGREFPQSAGRSSLVKQPVTGFDSNGIKACNRLLYTI